MSHRYVIPVTAVTFDCACGCRMGPSAAWPPYAEGACTCAELPYGHHARGCPAIADVDPHGVCPVWDRAERISQVEAERDAARRELTAAREERDAARREAADARAALAGIAAADAENQRAGLREHGLLDEFAAHVGCDLASWLGEAILVARREAAEAQAREAALREALVLAQVGLHDECPTSKCRADCRAATQAIADNPAGDRGALDALAILVARRDGAVWEAEAGRYQRQRDAARREAAEAQAREAALRKALADRNFCCRNVGTFADTDGSGGWCGECKEARKATIGVIAAPADRAALDALLAAERERCARIAESGGGKGMGE